MIQAYEITRDPAFLAEARQAVDALMERMRYRVKNEVYDRTYTSAGEFPLTASLSAMRTASLRHTSSTRRQVDQSTFVTRAIS